MKRYLVSFEENGSEYTGFLEIDCDTLEKVGPCTIKVNGALITLDEKIIEIKEKEVKEI